MDAMQTNFRPMGIADLADATFRLYRNNFLTLTGIVAIVFIPITILQSLLTLALGSGLTSDMRSITQMLQNFDPTQDSFSSLPISNLIAYYLILMGVVMIYGFFFYPLMSGAITYAISQCYLNRPISILDAYRFGLNRLLSLIVAGLLVGLIVGVAFGIPITLLVGAVIMFASTRQTGDTSSPLGAIALIMGFGLIFLLALILIIFLTTRFLFFTQAIVLEGQSPIGALGRSWQLVRGSFWSVLGMTLLISLIVQIITGVPAGTLGAIVGALFRDPINDYAIRQTLTSLISSMAQMFVLPLQLVALTLLYYNLRMRKEGYDLELMAQDITGVTLE